MGSILKATDKIQRYASCKVGDKVTLKKKVKDIRAHTEVEILDIRCNDKQKISETDLRNNMVEVSLYTFEYKISDDLWVTYDKLDIEVNAYRPRLKSCILEIILVIVLAVSGSNLFILDAFYILPSITKLVAGVSCYMALAIYMSLYEDKLKTNGKDLKLVKTRNTERKKLK